MVGIQAKRMKNPVISKATSVKRVFEQPLRSYLERRRHDIRVRSETVRSIVETFSYDNVLDIGCGDGSISLPLLREGVHLTLLDFSASMVAIAKSRIPAAFHGNVAIRNADFMASSFPSNSYDLVLCLGLLAHVDSPEDFIAKAIDTVRPGGRIIIEFTDSHHFMWRLKGLLRHCAWPALQIGKLCGAWKPPDYRVNKLHLDRVVQMTKENGAELQSMFRYSAVPLPGIHRVLSQDMLYRMIRFTFGGWRSSRNSWLGNEYICLFTVPGARNGQRAGGVR